jgi:hypothetical protein
MNDYVIPVLGGRLGNNLSMIANAYARAKDFNLPLLICREQVEYDNGVSNDNYSKTILAKFNFVDGFPDNGVVNPSEPVKGRPTVYAGYYQDEKYFDKYESDLQDLFGPSQEFIARIRIEIPQLFEGRVTAINVRRGDYLYYPNYHPTVTADYLTKAVEQIEKTDSFLILSDDIDWCKANLSFPNSTYITGYNSYEQLWIMSLCHDFVISNSSFSWWGAWLAKNKDKTVVAPETWFGPEHQADWQGQYCKGWTKLPTYFENGFILPK